jgi:hypothetical protein
MSEMMAFIQYALLFSLLGIAIAFGAMLLNLTATLSIPLLVGAISGGALLSFALGGLVVGGIAGGIIGFLQMEFLGGFFGNFFE